MTYKRKTYGMTDPQVMAQPFQPTSSPLRLPRSAIAAMALTGFLIIVTETLPAGLLPQIANGLGISEFWAGQFMTAYAAGAVVSAIPAVRFTRHLRRRPVLLLGILGFLVGNTLTAAASDVSVALAGRFIAGAASGLLWGMLPGYARAIAPPALAGRALSFALIGIPIGLSVGTPLGSFFGSVVDWRLIFLAMSVIAVGLLAWIPAVVPNAPGQNLPQLGPRSARIHHVVRIPGIPRILAVVFIWMLAHNILITYIAPFLANSATHLPVDTTLLIFGVSALTGTVVTGMLVDRMLRALVLTSLMAFGIAGVGLASSSVPVLILAVILWGLTFGSAAAPLQTASADVAGHHANTAQSVQATVWNLAIFGGALLGGLFLDTMGSGVFPAAIIALSVTAFVISFTGHRHAFPRGARADMSPGRH